MNKLIIKIIIICIFTIRSSASDTAFWKPYSSDKSTYCLRHFDKNIANDELLGDAKIIDCGKFSKALELQGKGALKINNSETFTGGTVSAEAWIKIKKYPDKKAYILYKTGNFKKSKSFALCINSDASIQLETTNCDRRKNQIYTVRSKSGVIPLNEWTHVAMIVDLRYSQRTLFVNGQELISKNLEHGTGIILFTEESQPTPLFVGNNNNLSAGMTGDIDELRIHKKIHKFWQQPKLKIVDNIAPISSLLLKEHQPKLYFSFDKNIEPDLNNGTKFKIRRKSGKFVAGIKNKAYFGKLEFNIGKLFKNKSGAIEFFFTPIGINCYDKGNKTILHIGRFLFGLRGGGKRISWRIIRSHDIWDKSKHDVYPGKWFHIILTWQDNNRKMYIDGQEVARDALNILTKQDFNFMTSIGIKQYKNNSVFAIDELYVYDKCLTEQEAENLYARYFYPDKIKKPEKTVDLFLKARYFPSGKKIIAQVSLADKTIKQAKIKFVLFNKENKLIFEKIAALNKNDIILNLPTLSDGSYCLKTYLLDDIKKKLAGEKFYFIHRNFPWLDNKLGITNKVSSPFVPIKINKNNVSMWARTYEMNGFGLWDKVISQGHNILASPIELKCESNGKILKWNFGQNKFVRNNDVEAIYSSKASCDALKISTTSTVEFDGCMRVDMKLIPNGSNIKIDKLWLDIPVKAKEAPLFHLYEVGKHSYAGKSPKGSGRIWDSSKATRHISWLNYFTPYVWLGGAERGICWFGENDKGWITKKYPEKSILQEIHRNKDTITIRVYLINKKVVLNKVHELTFGMQASPIKPMPKDWRKKLDDAPGGLGDYPWGGLSCSYKTPYQNDWRIIDKMVEARQTGKVDKEWFTDYAKKYNPPKVFGKMDWLVTVLRKARMNVTIGTKKPIHVYSEELHGCTYRKEFQIFQDEWRASRSVDNSKSRREFCDVRKILKSGRAFQSAAIVYPKSYRDFSCYISNEWLKRGIGLYWDCTMPKVAHNTDNSAAYKLPNGKIQPAAIIWNQRALHKRTWNLLNYWRKHRKEPLEWTIHTTNHLLLPLQPLGTVGYDGELFRKYPLSPEFLLTETVGRQYGLYPLFMFPIYCEDPIANKQSKKKKQRIDWGMRMVHEIKRPPCEMENLITDFGYKSGKVKIYNYWDAKKIMQTDNDKVKWLVIERPDLQEYLIILSSWDVNLKEVGIKFGDLFPIKPLTKVYNAETNEILNVKKRSCKVILDIPYGMKIIKAKIKQKGTK